MLGRVKGKINVNYNIKGHRCEVVPLLLTLAGSPALPISSARGPGGWGWAAISSLKGFFTPFWFLALQQKRGICLIANLGFKF